MSLHLPYPTVCAYCALASRSEIRIYFLTLGFIKQEAPKRLSATYGVEFSDRTLRTKNDIVVKVLSWDTPGTALVNHTSVAHCNRMNAIICCYDPTVRTSFLHLRLWLAEVTNKNPSAFFVMIATKKDLIEQGVARRVVTEAEAKTYATQNGRGNFLFTTPNFSNFLFTTPKNH